MGDVHLLFGYDTEAPYGDFSESEKGLALRETTLRVVTQVNDLFDRYELNRTFFLLGDFLERTVRAEGKERVKDVFNSENPFIDLQQHSYSHVPFRSIPTRPDRIPMSPKDIEADVKKASEFIEDLFGVEIVGMRSPLGYVGGLQGEQEVIAALISNGIKYISSDLRSQDGGLEPKLVEEGRLRQPHTYAGGLIEIPCHGWQDTALTGKSNTPAEGYPQGVDQITAYFIDLIDQARKLASEQERDVFVGLCLHPQAVGVYDPNLEVHTGLLEHALMNDVIVSGYTEAYKKLANLEL